MPRVCAGQRRGGGRGADLREEALSPRRAASDSPGCLTTPLDPVRRRRGRGPPEPPRRCASVRALGSVGSRLTGPLAWGRSWGRLGPGSPQRPPRHSLGPRGSPLDPAEPTSPGLGFCGPPGGARSSPWGQRSVLRVPSASRLARHSGHPARSQALRRTLLDLPSPAPDLYALVPGCAQLSPEAPVAGP